MISWGIGKSTPMGSFRKLAQFEILPKADPESRIWMQWLDWEVIP